MVQVEPICAIISTCHAPHLSNNLPWLLPPCTAAGMGSGTASAPSLCIPAGKRETAPALLTAAPAGFKGGGQPPYGHAGCQGKDSAGKLCRKAAFGSMSVLLQLGIAQTCSGGVFHHPPSPQPPAQAPWEGNRVFSIMQVPRGEAAAAPGSPGALFLQSSETKILCK